MIIIYLLFFFLAFVLLILLTGGLMLRQVVQRIFGRRNDNGYSQNAYQQSGYNQTRTQADSKSKIIDKNEGEYVDFEEVE